MRQGREVAVKEGVVRLGEGKLNVVRAQGNLSSSWLNKPCLPEVAVRWRCPG